MKRNEYILKRLILLNVKSIQEGLLQVLNYSNHGMKNRRRCSSIFLPDVEESFDVGNLKENRIVKKTTPVNIMNLAVEFCNKNSVDAMSCKIFVNNIDFKVKQRELWDFFEHFGKVLHVYIAKDKKSRRSRGFGFIVFSSPFEAQEALNAKKSLLWLNGRLLQVLPAVNKKKKNEKADPQEAKQKLKEAADYFINIKNEESSLSEEILVKENNNEIIDELCDDLLLEIFSYLDIRSRVRMELVCRRWHNIARLSWQQVKHICFKNVFNLGHTYASLTDKIFISILNKNCANLKSIDLSASPYLITISSLSRLASTCPKLEELNLSYVPLKKDCAKILGKNLTKLKKIQMSGCQNIGEKGYWWLFKDQIRLEELEITETARLVGNCIYMLPPTVTAINFESCYELSDVGLKYLASRCPSIRYLNLSFCVRISDEGLRLLLETCGNTTGLKLKGLGRNVTSIGLSTVKKLKHLKELDISRNVIVDDGLLYQVARSCKKLSRLNIEACHGNVSNTGIEYLCLCENLKELNVSYIISITDESVNKLAMEGKLQKLIIRSSPEISDQCALTCFRYLDNLALLDLSGCFYVTNNLAHLVSANIFTRTSSETMQIILGGTQVTNEGLQMLQEKLSFADVTMQNLQVGSLRNDRDSTLVRPFFPESSDEEWNEEETVEPELIVLKPDIELDIKADYPCVDEEGEKLWDVVTPDFRDSFNDCELDVEAEANNVLSPGDLDEASLNPVSLADRMADLNHPVEGTVEIEDEENWDNELEEGRVWSMPNDSFDGYSFLPDDCDDFLENDDLSRLELIG